MPFGLINSPATFNWLMADLFKIELNDFVLVFFDDILVYLENNKDHERHLRRTLKILRKAKLYAKRSKCTFLVNKVDYLASFQTYPGLEASFSFLELDDTCAVASRNVVVDGFASCKASVA